MKKLLTFLGLAIIGTSTMFANVEMDFHFYGTPYSKLTLTSTDVDGATTEESNKAFGSETQFNFMFCAPSNFIDIGINLACGLDAIIGNLVYVSDEGTADIPSLGYNVYFTLGPAVRFHIGDINSFLVAPGIIYNSSLLIAPLGSVGFSSSFSYWGFNLDLGYRYWFVNKTGFHFGFDIGTDLTFPFTETANIFSENFDLTSEMGVKIYLGICFNFGDKAPDKARNIEE